MALMGYSGARGTLIYEKNTKAKISCQAPFNDCRDFLAGLTALDVPQMYPKNFVVICKLNAIVSSCLSYLYG